MNHDRPIDPPLPPDVQHWRRRRWNPPLSEDAKVNARARRTLERQNREVAAHNQELRRVLLAMRNVPEPYQEWRSKRDADPRRIKRPMYFDPTPDWMSY